MKKIFFGIFLLTVLNQTSCESHSSLGDVEFTQDNNDLDTNVTTTVDPNENDSTGKIEIPGQYDGLDVAQMKSGKSDIKSIDEIGTMNTSGNGNNSSITEIQGSTHQDNLSSIKDNNANEIDNDDNDDNDGEDDGYDEEMGSDQLTEIDDDNVDNNAEPNQLEKEGKLSSSKKLVWRFIRDNPGAFSLLVGSLIGTILSVGGIPYLERKKPKCWVAIKNKLLKLKRAIKGKPSIEESKGKEPTSDSQKTTSDSQKTTSDSQKTTSDSQKTTSDSQKTPSDSKKTPSDSKEPTVSQTTVSS